MFKKIGSVVALGLVVGLMAIGPMATAAAAAPAAQGASTALVADGQWHALPAGEQAWYTFNYSGDGSQILIRMASPNVGGSNGGGFEVWTPDQYAKYQGGATVEPVGRGSANSYFGGDLIWTGNFNTAGAYYVIVTAGSSQADYTLTITGSGVTLPAAPAAQTQAAAPKANEVEAKTEAAETQATAPASTAPAAEQKKGASASDALAIDGKSANIAAGQEVWYAIPYGGGNSRMVIRMAVDSNHPASFAVYTATELANGADPVGIGSVDAGLGGDLVWAGGFPDAGTVYVVVTGNSTADTGYTLSVQ